VDVGWTLVFAGFVARLADVKNLVLTVLLLGFLGVAPGCMTPSGPVRKNQTYFQDGQRKLRLDLFYPETAPPPGGYPLIVSLHGGGWIIGNKTRDLFLRPMTREGYAVASVEYRLSGEAKYPAQIEDVRRATHWLREHAAALRLNPDRFVATGASAGGHLALLLAFSEGQQLVPGGSPPLPAGTIKAVCAFYPVVDLEGVVPEDRRDKPHNLVAALLGAPVTQRLAAARQGSPIRYIRPSSPPVFLIHGDEDVLVPYEQSVILANALAQAGVECTFVTYEGAVHGFGPRPKTRGEISRFLARHVGGDLPEKSTLP